MQEATLPTSTSAPRSCSSAQAASKRPAAIVHSRANLRRIRGFLSAAAELKNAAAS